MQDELDRFVASLRIPDDRKVVVRAELIDHVACAAEAAVREGRDPEAAGRAALGDLEALRRALEAVEPAFRITWWHAVARGLAASVLVGIALDQGGALMRGVVGALVALSIALVCAPPRALELLRAELRSVRVRGALGMRGVPIGPALAYAVTVMSGPFVVWIALIVQRTCAGLPVDDAPWSAFALAVAVQAVLLTEGIRARVQATA